MSAKHFQEKALSYLWNLKFWSFRKYTQKIKTRTGRTFLDYENDYEILEDKTGEPEGFYLKGDNILFYPTPDSDYTINIDYFFLPYGLNNAEEQIYELKEDDDYINIPERYETLFKNCLISLSMIYAIADDSDENHSGYQRQYENSLKTLIDYCQSGISDRRIIF